MEKRILVIDDSPTIGNTVEWLLAEHGYHVCIANDGLTALSMMKNFEPHLVLLDIRLPHMDGYQICEFIRAKIEYQSLPIIMLSGLRSDDAFQRALEAGADDFISKPVNDERLIAVINDHLAHQVA